MNKIKVIITQKELDSYKMRIKSIWTSQDGKEYPHSFSPSGMLIDELAYASDQWTSEDLHDNNFEYEPNEPYSFNYEDDLLANTKTTKELEKLILLLKTNTTLLLANEKTDRLQAGAYYALNYPNQWSTLLNAYKEKLHEDRTEGISKAYNKELQAEQNSYWENLDKEWLWEDHRDYAGVVYNIKKYFNAEEVVFNEKDNETFIFFFDKEETQGWTGEQLNAKAYKNYLLGEIIDACKARENAEKITREKRKAEREKTQAYKAQREAEAVAKRKAKLLSLTLKK